MAQLTKHFMKTSSVPILLVAVAALLSACGGAPSESAIKEAIDRQQAQQQKQLSQISQMFGSNAATQKMADSMKTNVMSVHKVGCKEDGKDAYRCDVEVEVGQAGRSQQVATHARYVKGSDGWVISE